MVRRYADSGGKKQERFAARSVVVVYPNSSLTLSAEPI